MSDYMEILTTVLMISVMCAGLWVIIWYIKRKTKMNENQRKWLKELQSKGVLFQVYVLDTWVSDNKCDFSYNVEKYRTPAQPVPDIPDWREVCRDMQNKGVGFKFLWGCMWENPGADLNFTKERDRYQIPAQPLPEWREDMTEPTETKPEVPHRALQIQWHKDKVRSLETGEPMREWECKRGANGEWALIRGDLLWREECEYRRKPRMKKVPLWYCLGQNISKQSEFNAFASLSSRENVIYQVEKSGYELFGAVVQDQAEIPEDLIPE